MTDAAQRFDLRKAGLQTYLDAIGGSSTLGEENGEGFFAYFIEDEFTATRVAETLECPHGQQAMDLAATLIGESLRHQFKAMAEHAVSGDDQTLESMLGQFISVIQHVASLTSIFEKAAELHPEANLVGGAVLRNLLTHTQAMTKALALKLTGTSDPDLAVKLAQELVFSQDRAQAELDQAVDAAEDAIEAAKAVHHSPPGKLN